MRFRSSVLTTWFDPFASAIWIAFLLSSLLVATVWTFALGDRQLASAVANPGLRDALAWLLRVLDVAWITLGAAAIYLDLTKTEGLSTARRWALIVLGGALLLAAASSRSGFPLGPIQYSRQLGAKIGPVPIGVPLLWFAIVISARETALRLAPRATHLALALATGALTFLTDLNLEPVAARLRGFWFWRAVPPTDPPHFTTPVAACAAWLIAGCVLAFFLREENVSDPRTRSCKPVAVFAILNAILLAANAGRLLRA